MPYATSFYHLTLVLTSADMLSCITGLDKDGPEAGTMEVIYNLYSIPHNIGIMVKTVLSVLRSL